MNINTLPKALKTIIDSEETDFIVKSKRRYPKQQGIVLLIFASLWNLILSPFIIQFINVLEVTTRTDMLDFGFLTFQTITIAIFFLLGFGLFIYAFVLLFQQGGYVIGTKSRLIYYRNNSAIIKDWNVFSGNIKIKNKGLLGSLELELKTGNRLSSRRKPSKHLPEIIYIIDIKDVLEIEKKIRIRIQEYKDTSTL